MGNKQLGGNRLAEKESGERGKEKEKGVKWRGRDVEIKEKKKTE